MFISQERSPARKPFQKPNILRRKPKTTKVNTEKNNGSMALPCIKRDFGLVSLPVQVKSQSLPISQDPRFKVKYNSEEYDNQGGASQTLIIDGNNLTTFPHDAQGDDTDLHTAQSTLNVESFLNGGSVKKEQISFNINDTSDNGETQTKRKWCLNLIDYGSDHRKDTVTSYYDGSQRGNICIEKTEILCSNVDNESIIDSSFSEANLSLEDVEVPAEINFDSENISVTFMCDAANCKKSFCTKERLQKHKYVHNKPKTFPVLHCPVKSSDADGAETQCHRTFRVRNQLMKHLNDDHSSEEALYKCAKCGRRFYWSCGARLHQANGCTRTYTCAWAGCGRVFRQLCRLREHARAHTGDRPYPCHYPGCGWAFRSASKLMRHARRHTGERRHACGACGRAFPRAEHLREHAARQHAPAPAPAPAPPSPTSPHLLCTYIGCEQAFSTTSSLYAHMKKVHNDMATQQPPRKQKRTKKDKFSLLSTSPQIEEIETSIEPIPDDTSEQTMFEPSVRAVECTSVEMEGASGEGAGVADGRSARTHCTWPLRPRDEHYSLEEHAQVEQSESCESNIYSVRSDLFLHGNLLINEDSEFIISRAATGGEGAVGEGGAAEGALGFIDSHPTGDLTQEELMYADAVDESSFRVFLLNGEELV